jgi:branched-chain amino acid transport system permease protein
MASNIRPSGVFDTNYSQDIALDRTLTDKILKNGAIVLLLLLPLLTSAGPLGLNVIPLDWIGFINLIAVFIIAVQGLNILVGYAGLISLGHAAFMGVGAYTAAIMAREWGTPFLIALPAAALFTGFVGLMFGLPSLRVKGFYLSMATLAAQFIIPWLLRNPLAPISGGSNPLAVPAPNILGIEFNSASSMFYLIIPLAVLLALAARNISRTRTGRALISIRDNDLAAELLGINVFAYKLQAFFLSSLYAGIAGALLAYNYGTISIQNFELNNSINMLGMLVIGGAGFPLGPLFGVTFFKVMEFYLLPALRQVLITPDVIQGIQQTLPFITDVKIQSATDPIMFGLALIIFLILEPRGLAHRWEILKIAWKIRPYSH